MASVNKVILIGNLTRDPELRYTPKGTAVAEIGLACNRRYKVDNDLREEVTYVDITFWGAQAETVSKYLENGRSVYVEGRLKLDTWEDKETGKRRHKLGVIGEQFQFLDGGNRSASGSPEGSPTSRTSASPAPAPSSNASSAPPDDEDDDIPF